MHEKLIKSLRACAENSTTRVCLTCPWALHQKGCITAMVTAAADAIEELEEKAQALAETLYAYEHPWIPVTERLPDAASGDVSERVLVTDGKDVVIAEWFNFEECEPFWSYTGFGKDVTHWMPLPEPPKEE